MPLHETTTCGAIAPVEMPFGKNRQLTKKKPKRAVSRLLGEDEDEGQPQAKVAPPTIAAAAPAPAPKPEENPAHAAEPASSPEAKKLAAELGLRDSAGSGGAAEAAKALVDNFTHEIQGWIGVNGGLGANTPESKKAINAFILKAVSDKLGVAASEAPAKTAAPAPTQEEVRRAGERVASMVLSEGGSGAAANVNAPQPPPSAPSNGSAVAKAFLAWAPR